MRNHGILWCLFAILLLTANACKDPEDIGLEVLPAGEQMGIAWIDTFTIEARTVDFDSVRTSSRGTYIIGDFNDPIFGEVKAQVFTQFLLSTEGYEFGAATVDSVVLNLVYSGSYGRTDKLQGLQKFVVSEVTEDLVARDELNFYSDDSYTIDQSNPLAEIEFAPNLLDDVPTSVDTVPPSLRVLLRKDFGQEIVDLAYTTELMGSNDNLVSEFKGLNIRPTTTGTPSGNGGLLYFSMADVDTRLEVYYHSADDTSYYFFEISEDGEIFTAKDAVVSPTVENAINTGLTSGDEKLYLQSFAGTRVRVALPHLRKLNELGYIAVNKAELVLPVDQSSLDDFGLPEYLQIVSINEYDSAFSIIDVYGELTTGIDYYGGQYDSDNQEYIFNISRHLQETLNDAGPDYGFYITPVIVMDGSRVVFNGPMHSGTGDSLKLRMTYTIID